MCLATKTLACEELTNPRFRCARVRSVRQLKFGSHCSRCSRIQRYFWETCGVVNGIVRLRQNDSITWHRSDQIHRRIDDRSAERASMSRTANAARRCRTDGDARFIDRTKEHRFTFPVLIQNVQTTANPESFWFASSDEERSPHTLHSPQSKPRVKSIKRRQYRRTGCRR